MMFVDRVSVSSPVKDGKSAMPGVAWGRCGIDRNDRAVIAPPTLIKRSQVLPFASTEQNRHTTCICGREVVGAVS